MARTRICFVGGGSYNWTPKLLADLALTNDLAGTIVLHDLAPEPLAETLFCSLYLYEKGFQSFEMGYTSAMAWVLLAMIALTTVALFKVTGRFVYYETDVDKR